MFPEYDVIVVGAGHAGCEAAAAAAVITGDAAPVASAAPAPVVAAPKIVKPKVAKPKAPRKTTAASGMNPSPALAAVIGSEPIARTQVIKKLWDYIKEHGLQDAKDKRSINADAKLLAVFGKPQVTMFELAGIAGKHLTA